MNISTCRIAQIISGCVRNVLLYFNLIIIPGEVASSVFVFSHPKQNEIRCTQYLKAMLQQKIMKRLWSLWFHFLMGEKESLDGISSNANNPEDPCNAGAYCIFCFLYLRMTLSTKLIVVLTIQANPLLSVPLWYYLKIIPCQNLAQSKMHYVLFCV